MNSSNSEQFEGKNWRIKSWFPDFSDNTLDLIKSYYVELLNFNKTINLISAKTEIDSDLVHFSDCILGSQLMMLENKCEEIYDIGSGNGLPGIIIGILNPQQVVYLIESDARKVEFMKFIISKLKLSNVSVKHTRLEDLQENIIKCAVSRGFAPIQKSILLSRKHCCINAKYFHFKGENWVKEIADIPSQICRYWSVKHVGDYSLPIGNTKLSIVMTQKIS